ncbi:MAG: ribosome biogenesis GTPase YlqF [Eubacteriales bacterium]|nr:ribosome biogenesis GTPase YlqF [Eubacteriales bacterium]
MHLQAPRVQWYPGHMAKAFRLLEEKLSEIDVFVEICDARLPISSQNPKLHQLIEGRPQLLILNKADIADPRMTEAWLHELNRGNVRAIALSSLDLQGERRDIEAEVRRLCRELLERQAARDRRPRAMRLAITGIPNCGKSTFINACFGRKKLKAENRPGVTRQLQWIAAPNGDFEWLDTPGLLWPKIADPVQAVFLVGIAAIRDEVIDVLTLAFDLFIFLLDMYPQELLENYKIFALYEQRLASYDGNRDLIFETQDFALELFEAAAKKRGCIRQGARLDLERFASIFLQDFRQARFGRLTYDFVDARSDLSRFFEA